MSIPKSSSKIGTVRFSNGNETTLYIRANTNTGETQLWQEHNGKATRLTGRNICRLGEELDHVLNEGEAHWVGDVNDAALDVLRNITHDAG